MSKKLTFQEIILTLQQFWNDQGCMLMQAYDNEKGAGTMSPYTFLRAIGPEPWNAAYVEPSRRPADGRYGENPNRLYQHHQFQVVMKPSPSNIQELYLQSLELLGINPLEHDIRFVEDNWENPSTGSAGLGWEVWLDGMENHSVHLFPTSWWIGNWPCYCGSYLWFGALSFLHPRSGFCL